MSVSAPTRTRLQRVSDPFGVLTLLTINGAGLAQTVRICDDLRGPDTPVFNSRGNGFVALPFEITLPKSAAKEVPRVQLRIDNVGREITADLEALPPGAELMATVERVHRTTPDVVEYTFTAPMGSVQVSVLSVSANIGMSELMRRPAVDVRFDPITAPGLFPN
jgi:hypothetical protein